MSDHEVNASLIAPALSGELVSQGLLQGMLRQAEIILAEEGTRTTINGVPATVSRSFAPTTVGDKQFFARVYKFLPNSDLHESAADMLPGIVFDETEDVTVQTPNPYAMRFMEFGDVLRLQFDDVANDMVAPVVDDPAHVALFKTLLTAIEGQTKELQLQQETTRRYSRQDRLETIGHAARASAIGLVVLSVIGGVVYLIATRDRRNTQEKFDGHNYTLPGGRQIAVGQSLSPEYVTTIPSFGTIPGFEYTSGKYDYADPLDPSETLREVDITSSKKGKNCTAFPINNVPPTSVLRAWTDFVDPATGRSRADELSVTFHLDKGRVCWNGQERNKEDDPRVIVSLNPR